jgi:hypothetical protein
MWVLNKTVTAAGVVSAVAFSAAPIAASEAALKMLAD